jgi:hypothetical protein
LPHTTHAVRSPLFCSFSIVAVSILSLAPCSFVCNSTKLGVLKYDGRGYTLCYSPLNTQHPGQVPAIS